MPRATDGLAPAPLRSVTGALPQTPPLQPAISLINPHGLRYRLLAICPAKRPASQSGAQCCLAAFCRQAFLPIIADGWKEGLSGGWPPAAAEREGPDDSELLRSNDDDGVGRDWSSRSERNPPKAFFPTNLQLTKKTARGDRAVFNV